MKIKTVSNAEIEVSDSFNELTFNIRSSDMGFILDILRSKMYKNPIEAICREITSNARDANREAGKKNVPIEISFEQDFMSDNICLVISDSGVGISEERMGDVFINYGASTKRETNTQTGGFGLGAKTPFSYTDNFSIVTKVNGMKYNYIAIIEQNSNGKILMISKEETDEPNGTKIYIPIKYHDRKTFEYGIIKNTVLWEVRPIYKNFEYMQEEYYNEIKIERHNDFTIVKEGRHFFRSSIYLLIDDIPYDLDCSVTDLSCYGISTSNVYFLNFKTGMLNISATRENVHYEKETIKKIQNRFKSFIDYAVEYLSNSLKECNNYIEAVCMIKKFNEESQYNDFVKLVRKQNDINLVWNGIDLNWYSYRIDLRMFRFIKLTNNNYRTFVDNYSSDMLTNKFYILDRAYIDEGRALSINSDYCYILEPIDKRVRKFNTLPYSIKKDVIGNIKKMQEEIKKLEEFGIKCEMFSNIVPNKKYKAEKKEYFTLKYIEKFNNYTDTISSDFSDIDKNAYYIIRDYRNETYQDKNKFENIKNIVAFLDVKMYILGKSMEKKIKSTSLKNIETEIPNLLKNNQNIIKIINRKYVSDNMSSLSYMSLNEELDILNSIDFGQDFRDSVDKISNILNDKVDKGFSNNQWNIILEEYKKYHSLDFSDIDKQIKKIKEIFQKYPLVEALMNTYGHIESKFINELNLYIKYKNLSKTEA